jgi:hypothetical protein
MNKPIKAKNLPLFSIIDLNQLRRENHLEGTEVTDFFTARDGKVYLLMEQPSETQGKDWLSTPSTYTAVEIQLDWAEQRVLETTLFPLGLLKFQFHYLRPAGDHFLLLGARCAYRENGPDQNAWIVSRDGAVLSRFCLGDGIQDCVVKKDGTIITSYFDEGVFGNYGWDEPLGDCGLIAWTSDGTPLWKNEKYSIYDCYAISLDEEENLWFYYYDEFRLVRTNFKEDFVFELPIEGSGAFSVAPSGNTFRHIHSTVSCHPKPATVHKLTNGQMTRQANASAKSKELQPTAQSPRFAAHLLLPQPHHRQLTLTFTENRISITKALTNFEV